MLLIIVHSLYREMKEQRKETSVSAIIGQLTRRNYHAQQTANFDSQLFSRDFAIIDALIILLGANCKYEVHDVEE